jgi:uncharacterized protein YbaR (Trm112 family)
MAQYIPKSALVAEIKERIETYNKGYANGDDSRADALEVLLHDIDTLEVIDPYELWVQYPSVKDAIQAHAEIYSFNIESELFPQLAKEQQVLWRKEIEQACISGGYDGVELARDPRYKENFEVKEVDLEKEINSYFKGFGKFPSVGIDDCIDIAKHFFELGLCNTITEEDCKLIWNIGDEIPNMPEEEFFKELLRRYKAQKGE